MTYTGISPKQIEEMLGEIGVKSVEALFSTIPQPLRLKRLLNLPAGLDESARV